MQQITDGPQKQRPHGLLGTCEFSLRLVNRPNKMKQLGILMNLLSFSQLILCECLCWQLRLVVRWVLLLILSICTFTIKTQVSSCFLCLTHLSHMAWVCKYRNLLHGDYQCLNKIPCHEIVLSGLEISIYKIHLSRANDLLTEINEFIAEIQ